MMKKIILLTLLGMALTSAKAQQIDTLVYKRGLAPTITYKGSVIKYNRFKDLKDVFDRENAPEICKKELRRFRTWKTVSDIIGGIGGGLTGFYLGSTIAGGKVEKSVLWAGLGGIALSIPPMVLATSNIRNAVRHFNEYKISATTKPKNWQPE